MKLALRTLLLLGGLIIVDAVALPAVPTLFIEVESVMLLLGEADKSTIVEVDETSSLATEANKAPHIDCLLGVAEEGTDDVVEVEVEVIEETVYEEEDDGLLPVVDLLLPALLQLLLLLLLLLLVVVVVDAID
jgi:hypothetical protein